MIGEHFICLQFISPLGNDSFRSGLLFWRRHVYFLFISSRYLWAPSADVSKFCIVVGSEPISIMQVEKFGGIPQKIVGAINMQNLAWFLMTSNFDGECLRNRWRYSKSDKYLIDHDFSHIRQKSSVNFGPLATEI